MIVATSNEITPEKIAQLEDMGFSAEVAREAIEKSSGNVQEAINDLMTNKRDQV